MSWVENADNCAGFGATTSPSTPWRSRPRRRRRRRRDPPVLFGAVPNAVGSNLGVAGCLGQRTRRGPGRNLRRLASTPSRRAPSARKTLARLARVGLETNDGGIGAFAARRPRRCGHAGTLVAATASVETAFRDLELRRRRPNNVSWPTAFALAWRGRQPGTASAAPARRAGSRCRSCPTAASTSPCRTCRPTTTSSSSRTSRRSTTSSSAGAPGQRARISPSTTSTRQGAETPVDLFNTSQYNPSSWDPTNWKPDLNTSVFSPPSTRPPSTRPRSTARPFTSPHRVLAHRVLATEYSPTEYLADGVLADGVLAHPVQPRRVGELQPGRSAGRSRRRRPRACVAISASAGTGDESVSVNTWNNTGFFYFRVQGKNGSFDPGSRSRVEVSSGRATSARASRIMPFTPPRAGRADVRTLILTDSSRMPLGAHARDEADHVRRTARGGRRDRRPRADRSSALNAQADGNPGCPYAKNLVAGGDQGDRGRVPATDRRVRRRRRRRQRDPVLPLSGSRAARERDGCTCRRCSDNTASQASLRLGYVLSDDFLASSTTVSSTGTSSPFPISRSAASSRRRRRSRGCSTRTSAPNGASDADDIARDRLRLPRRRRDIDQDHAGDQDRRRLRNDETLITNQGVSPGTVGNAADGQLDGDGPPPRAPEPAARHHLPGRPLQRERRARRRLQDERALHRAPTAPATTSEHDRLQRRLSRGLQHRRRPRDHGRRRRSSTGRRRSRRRRRRSSRARATSTATPTSSPTASGSTRSSRSQLGGPVGGSLAPLEAALPRAVTRHCPRSTRRRCSRRRSSACRC